MSTYPIVHPLLVLKGTVRVMRGEAADARHHNQLIQPEVLEQYACLIDSAVSALEAQKGGPQ